MTKSIVLFLFCTMTFLSKAQNDIIYSFDQPVLDSLIVGIRNSEKLYKKDYKELKIYALIESSHNKYEIYLLETCFGMTTGIKEVMRTSRRKLKITDDIILPVLFQTDILSNQIRNDKIAHLPYAGYYIEVILENGKQKVTKTRILF